MSTVHRNIRFTPPSTGTINPGQEAVLLLEDDPRILALVSGALAPVLDGMPLFKAQTIKDALTIANACSVRIFILDVELPDGTGYDFYKQVRDSHRAHTVVITGTPLIVDPGFSERFGAAHVLKKPFDILALQSTISNLLKTPVPEPQPQPKEEPTAKSNTEAPKEEHAQTFAATLHSLTPVDIIQLKCIGRSTTTLVFSASHGKTGYLFLKSGEIVHALTDKYSGINAFNEIVSWQGGRVSEAPPEEHERTIRGSWEALLMDALRLVDESVTAQ